MRIFVIQVSPQGNFLQSYLLFEKTQDVHHICTYQLVCKTYLGACNIPGILSRVHFRSCSIYEHGSLQH